MSTTIELEVSWGRLTITRYCGPSGPGDRMQAEITITGSDGNREQVHLPWATLTRTLTRLESGDTDE